MRCSEIDVGEVLVVIILGMVDVEMEVVESEVWKDEIGDVEVRIPVGAEIVHGHFAYR